MKAVGWISIVAALLISTVAVSELPKNAGEAAVLIADRAFDGPGTTLHNVRIQVNDGKIAALSGPGTGTVIDLRGYTVLPGWIDAHVHIASHFDRTGHLASSSEPPADAALEMAEGAWQTLMAGSLGHLKRCVCGRLARTCQMSRAIEVRCNMHMCIDPTW